MHKGTQHHHVFFQAVTITPDATQETLKPSTHLWVGVFVCLVVPVFYGKPLASHRLVTKRVSTISDHRSRVRGTVGGEARPKAIG